METTFTKEKKIFTGVVVLLVLAVLAGGYFFSSNQFLSRNLNNEKLNSEMLLSEKLALQKEVDSFKTQVSDLSGKNSELDEVLKQTSLKLQEKEAALSRISRENGNIKQMRKELADLTQMKNDFESKVLSLNESIQKLNKEKDALNQTIASLQGENKKLTANVDLLSSMTRDNYLVETMKRKDRLTVFARRTKKMSLTFKVPDYVVENISFKIIKPDGKIIEGKENGVACRVIYGDEGLTASLDGAGTIHITRQIEMIYEPKEKQKPGMYKIEMYIQDTNVGTFNVKLR